MHPNCMYTVRNVRIRIRCVPSSSMGFPRWTYLWQSIRTQLYCSNLDLLLQCRHRVGLHDGLCWLCLHLGLFAEHDPHARFGGRLCPGLQTAEAGKSEDTVLFNFRCCDCNKAVDDL